MNETFIKPCTAFVGSRLLSAGPLVEVALAVRNASGGSGTEAILTFDDATGRVVDLDLRGTKADLIARLADSPAPVAVQPKVPEMAGSGSAAVPPARGRPKLGVVAREVTLLPRHWEWLSAQPGGASVALRRLVEEARRVGGSRQDRRAAQEAAYHVMSALAGDLPGYEEAIRALFADHRVRFEDHTAGWPGDVRDYAVRLGFVQAP
ncbi:DUF2239 family protein [Acidisphaera sp. S103]|uniref:DUF2239 family protein n=1 Tax=Acidisphaera sp. S103 TaxID=1747223 RepID=UPI00131DD264|nr:DUF2239 family protein [Acidisphaera sp. S103]